MPFPLHNNEDDRDVQWKTQQLLLCVHLQDTDFSGN